MSRDVSRLFSMIKQADLPYQVFEDDTATPPAREIAPETVHVANTDLPANEDAPPAHSGLFKAYNVEAALAPAPVAGVPLADIFRRMAKR